MNAATQSLRELEQRASFELECLSYPSRSWVKAHRYHNEPVNDVLIVGGGQSAIAIAFRLLRERVTNFRIFDHNLKGREGPWVTFARMHTLRTPKEVTGPELGIPSLSARAWYEVQFGRDAWSALGKIPRTLWHDYLHWLRRVAGIDVTHGATIVDIEPIEQRLFAVTVLIDGKSQIFFARNVVLATGLEGSGRWVVPVAVENALPRNRYAHTSEAIDFATLTGRRIAVIGAGASAFDNAATALEHGAAGVDLYCRRPRLPAVNPNRWIEFAGFLRHYGDLDDAMKWRFMKLIFDMNQPPPQDAFQRCVRFPSFTLHLSSPISDVRLTDDAIELQTPFGVNRADYLIAGTGFAIDFEARPELTKIAPHIARWSDRYTPPSGEESALLGDFPYLSGCFQFTEKITGTAPYLKNIFCYTYAAMPSLACSAGISQLKFGVDRIGFGITRELFLEDAEDYFADLQSYHEPELDMSAYDPAGCAESAAPTKRVSR